MPELEVAVKSPAYNHFSNSLTKLAICHACSYEQKLVKLGSLLKNVAKGCSLEESEIEGIEVKRIFSVGLGVNKHTEIFFLQSSITVNVPSRSPCV
jgi:hypothetical protein